MRATRGVETRGALAPFRHGATPRHGRCATSYHIIQYNDNQMNKSYLSMAMDQIKIQDQYQGHGHRPLAQQLRSYQNYTASYHILPVTNDGPQIASDDTAYSHGFVQHRPRQARLGKPGPESRKRVRRVELPPLGKTRLA